MPFISSPPPGSDDAAEPADVHEWPPGWRGSWERLVHRRRGWILLTVLCAHIGAAVGYWSLRGLVAEAHVPGAAAAQLMALSTHLGLVLLPWPSSSQRWLGHEVLSGMATGVWLGSVTLAVVVKPVDLSAAASLTAAATLSAIACLHVHVRGVAVRCSERERARDERTLSRMR